MNSADFPAHDAEALAEAPGRVNLLGEHTDYNDGFVLPVAIAQRTRVAMRPNGGTHCTLRAEELGKTVRFRLGAPPAEQFATYVYGCLVLAQSEGADVPGLDITVSSRVPMGVGLSSSAALEVATLRCLRQLLGLWLRPWTVEAAGESEAVLGLHVEASDAWPWAFSARQVYTLAPDGLRVDMTLANADDAPMPAGIGHHPYFPHPPGTRLTTETRAMWTADAEVLPTGLDAGGPVPLLRKGTDLAALDLDNNFAGWGRTGRIDWPAGEHGPARSLLLQAQAPLDYFVLYCPRGYPYFCAEPVSQCTDWLNLLGQYDPQDLGGTCIAPGECLAASFTLRPAR